ncbi:MAG: GNAT family N-acetyltransferase [Flavisolibacter sp.]
MQGTITTNRLLLEALSSNDKSFILELVNSEGWLTYIGDRKIYSLENAAAYIQKINDNPDITYWVAKLKEDFIPIGIVTLIKRAYLEHHDIGFAFLPAFTNHGYAFEATQEVLSHISCNAGHSHILATTLPGNKSSIRLLEKLGLQLSKEIEVGDERLHVYGMATNKPAISKNQSGGI